jgi:hypothetical protein
MNIGFDLLINLFLGLKQPLKPKELLEKWGGGKQATHYFAT